MFHYMIVLIGIFGAITVVWLASLRWRFSIKLALFVVVIEGVLRKWVLPQANELIYFLKDGILIGAYLGYFLQYGRYYWRGLGVWMALMSIILAIQTLNPAISSLAVGILGTKGYLMYVPLCFVLPNLFRTSAELKSFLQWYLLLCIPTCILGIMQFYAPADSPLNIYAPNVDDQMVEAFGESNNVRITGTFPYLSGYSTYLSFCLALLFPLLIHQKKWLWRLLTGAELLLITTNLFMTGARSAVFTSALLFVGFLIASLFATSRNSRLIALVLVLTGALALGVAYRYSPEAVDAFSYRTSETEDNTGLRMLFSVTEPFTFLTGGGLVGYGSGALQSAGDGLRRQFNLGPPAVFPPRAEIETTRIMLELGLVGFLVWYAGHVYLVHRLWRVFRTLRDPFLRYLALAAFMLHLIWFTAQIVNNTTAGVYFWFLAGFAFLLPRLDRATRRQRLTASRGRLPTKPSPQPLPLPGLPPVPLHS